MANTTKKIAVGAITLHRKGKALRVKPGQPVELTDDELEDIERLNPEAIRDPINESEKHAKGVEVDPKAKLVGKQPAAKAGDTKPEDM